MAYIISWRPEFSARNRWTVLAETSDERIAADEFSYPSADLVHKSLLRVRRGTETVGFGVYLDGHVKSMQPTADYFVKSSGMHESIKSYGFNWDAAWYSLDAPNKIVAMVLGLTARGDFPGSLSRISGLRISSAIAKIGLSRLKLLTWPNLISDARGVLQSIIRGEKYTGPKINPEFFAAASSPTHRAVRDMLYIDPAEPSYELLNHAAYEFRDELFNKLFCRSIRETVSLSDALERLAPRTEETDEED